MACTQQACSHSCPELRSARPLVGPVYPAVLLRPHCHELPDSISPSGLATPEGGRLSSELWRQEQYSPREDRLFAAHRTGLRHQFKDGYSERLRNLLDSKLRVLQSQPAE